MAKRKKVIPAVPKSTGISKEEEQFLETGKAQKEEKPKKDKGNVAKGYHLSFTPNFIDSLDEFIEEFPEEQNRSSVAVRAMSLYMRLKREGKIM